MQKLKCVSMGCDITGYRQKATGPSRSKGFDY